MNLDKKYFLGESFAIFGSKFILIIHLIYSGFTHYEVQSSA